MNDPTHFLNPLENPILLPVIERFIWVFVLGFILILLLSKFKLKGLWKSNIGKRYVSWLFIGPIYLAAVFFSGDIGLLFLIVVMFLAVREIQRIAKLPGLYTAMLYVASALTIYVASYQNWLFYSLPLLYFVVFTLVAIQKNDAKRGLFNSALSLFVSIWLIFSLAHFVLLGHLNNDLDMTKSLMILIGFAVPLSDIFAYVVGGWFHKIGFLDKYKVADKISPKKTYAGILGNIIGAGLGIWIMYFAIGHYLHLIHYVILAILIGCMNIVGDLTESMFKRYFNVKDSGTLLPGHGGILDRIDSAMRVIVVVYYYLLFFL